MNSFKNNDREVSDYGAHLFKQTVKFDVLP